MMKDWRAFFNFNRQERNGIFYLCLGILIFQFVYFTTTLRPGEGPPPEYRVDTAWEEQLKAEAAASDSLEIYPFNPNYFSDFKGYLLGLTPEELDRLYAYRAKGFFMDSAADFKRVTGISDLLLSKLEPYLRFEGSREKMKPGYTGEKSVKVIGTQAGANLEPGDLNTVSSSELQGVYGIGPVLSERIIRFRNALGGFLVDEQLFDVYGLNSEVAARTLRRFRVLRKPEITLVDINEASAEELADLVYISLPLAEAIIRRREELGIIRSFDEITHLDDFPTDKIDRIRLYLRL